jgi:hypothetical protein
VIWWRFPRNTWQLSSQFLETLFFLVWNRGERKSRGRKGEEGWKEEGEERGRQMVLRVVLTEREEQRGERRGREREVDDI